MINWNERGVESPYQKICWELLRIYEESLPLGDYSHETITSLISSELLALQDEFGRFGVSDSRVHQQPLQDNHQFPLNSGDQGMNNRENWFPSDSQPKTRRELSRSDAPKPYNYDFHEGNTRGSGSAMGSQYTSLNGNFGDVSFTPSNPFYDHPWSYVFGYNKIHTNHDTILSCAKDRLESRVLQDVIAKGSKETVDEIFDNLISHVCELMIDPFGHQVFQKLLEKCTVEQITRVLDTLTQQPHQFVRVCVDSHGSHAIQALMQNLCSIEQISRFMATLCHVALRLTKNVNSNVIMFCLNQLSPSHSKYLMGVIVQHCYEIATDQHGYFLIKQCIGQCSRELRDILIKEIITNALRLCMNCYGNYLVQYVLELEDYQVARALSKHLDGNYVQLSYDKYGSHAVHKCLKSREFCSRRIITELLSDIDSLLVNPFGNYVIQTAWIVSQDDVQNVLLYHINRNVPFMKCNRYGRKVLEKLNLRT
ncbi:PREDICTED: pumilio homolog 15-like [Camelina sativa]|uniref:Pumilio homolog 15-like n=1 Tax=Camelina sativa TaxID=90675 RepID=A0ABM0VY75_CAMSA|nr:PREDICTED: pumilio homolog 15-like [Camelina sativa]